MFVVLALNSHVRHLCARAMGAVQVNGEQHWHRIGDVALLFLDPFGHRVLPDGRRRPDNVLFGRQQWRLINEALSADAVNWLIVVSGVPLVDSAVKTAPISGTGASTVAAN